MYNMTSGSPEKTTHVGFRASRALLLALVRQSRAEDLDVSKFIRRAIRKELSKAWKKEKMHR